MSGCLEKQTAGDTKSGSEKASPSAGGKSQNFLDRTPKCFPHLLSELSFRTKSWTYEGASGEGFPQSGTLDTQREELRSDFFISIL